MMLQEAVYPIILILLSIIGFFLRTLIRKVDELNNTIIKYAEKSSHMESEIFEIKEEIKYVRERQHKYNSTFNAHAIQIERLKAQCGKD